MSNNKMVMAYVGHIAAYSLQADSQPRSVGLVWGSAAAWHWSWSVFVRWTGWTLAVTESWWQHYKHCHSLLLLLLLLFNDWVRCTVLISEAREIQQTVSHGCVYQDTYWLSCVNTLIVVVLRRCHWQSQRSQMRYCDSWTHSSTTFSHLLLTDDNKRTSIALQNQSNEAFQYNL